MKPAARFRLTAIISLAVLVLLCLCWELWLAPLRPGGSWLALKALPLFWMLPGIWRERTYTYRISTMLILAYFSEGVVRAYTEQGMSARLAIAEIVTTVIFFSAAIAHVRTGRAVKSPTPETAG